MAKAGLEGRVQLRNGLLAHTKAVKELVLQDAQDAALAAGIAGEIEVENVIATVPSSLSPGKVGRIWTGQMIEAVDADVKKSGTKITVRVGWLRKKKAYFLVQEHGGVAFGRDIVGMHALDAGLAVMERELRNRGIH